MKTFKKLVSGLKKQVSTPYAYASIGNREDIGLTNQSPEDEPVGEFGIADRESYNTPSITTGIGRDQDQVEPYAFGGIGDRNKFTQIDEIWDSAIPLSQIESGDKVKESTKEEELERKRTYYQHMKMKEQHGPHIKKVDRDHHVAMYAQDSGELNRFLIQMHKKNLSTEIPQHFRKHHADVAANKNTIPIRRHPDEIREWHDSLHSIINSAPKLEQDTDAYTGIGPQFDISELRKNNGDVVKFPAFTSTSLDPNVALRFAGNKTNDEVHKPMKEVVKFKLKKDTSPGVYVATHSGHENEMEYLLKSGITARFIGEPRVYKNRMNNESYLVHEAEIDQ